MNTDSAVLGSINHRDLIMASVQRFIRQEGAEWFIPNPSFEALRKKKRIRICLKLGAERFEILHSIDDRHIALAVDLGHLEDSSGKIYSSLLEANHAMRYDTPVGYALTRNGHLQFIRLLTCEVDFQNVRMLLAMAQDFKAWLEKKGTSADTDKKPVAFTSGEGAKNGRR